MKSTSTSRFSVSKSDGEVVAATMTDSSDGTSSINIYEYDFKCGNQNHNGLSQHHPFPMCKQWVHLYELKTSINSIRTFDISLNALSPHRSVNLLAEKKRNLNTLKAVLSYVTYEGVGIVIIDSSNKVETYFLEFTRSGNLTSEFAAFKNINIKVFLENNGVLLSFSNMHFFIKLESIISNDSSVISSKNKLLLVTDYFKSVSAIDPFDNLYVDSIEILSGRTLILKLRSKVTDLLVVRWCELRIGTTGSVSQGTGQQAGSTPSTLTLLWEYSSLTSCLPICVCPLGDHGGNQVSTVQVKEVNNKAATSVARGGTFKKNSKDLAANASDKREDDIDIADRLVIIVDKNCDFIFVDSHGITSRLVLSKNEQYESATASSTGPSRSQGDTIVHAEFYSKVGQNVNILVAYLSGKFSLVSVEVVKGALVTQACDNVGAPDRHRLSGLIETPIWRELDELKPSFKYMKTVERFWIFPLYYTYSNSNSGRCSDSSAGGAWTVTSEEGIVGSVGVSAKELFRSPHDVIIGYNGFIGIEACVLNLKRPELFSHSIIPTVINDDNSDIEACFVDDEHFKSPLDVIYIDNALNDSNQINDNIVLTSPNQWNSLVCKGTNGVEMSYKSGMLIDLDDSPDDVSSTNRTFNLKIFELFVINMPPAYLQSVAASNIVTSTIRGVILTHKCLQETSLVGFINYNKSKSGRSSTDIHPFKAYVDRPIPLIQNETTILIIDLSCINSETSLTTSDSNDTSFFGIIQCTKSKFRFVVLESSTATNDSYFQDFLFTNIISQYPQLQLDPLACSDGVLFIKSSNKNIFCVFSSFAVNVTFDISYNSTTKRKVIDFRIDSLLDLSAKCVSGVSSMINLCINSRCQYLIALSYWDQDSVEVFDVGSLEDNSSNSKTFGINNLCSIPIHAYHSNNQSIQGASSSYHPAVIKVVELIPNTSKTGCFLAVSLQSGAIAIYNVCANAASDVTSNSVLQKLLAPCDALVRIISCKSHSDNGHEGISLVFSGGNKGYRLDFSTHLLEKMQQGENISDEIELHPIYCGFSDDFSQLALYRTANGFSNVGMTRESRDGQRGSNIDTLVSNSIDALYIGLQSVSYSSDFNRPHGDFPFQPDKRVTQLLFVASLNSRPTNGATKIFNLSRNLVIDRLATTLFTILLCKVRDERGSGGTSLSIYVLRASTLDIMAYFEINEGNGHRFPWYYSSIDDIGCVGHGGGDESYLQLILLPEITSQENCASFAIVQNELDLDHTEADSHLSVMSIFHFSSTNNAIFTMGNLTYPVTPSKILNNDKHSHGSSKSNLLKLRLRDQVLFAVDNDEHSPISLPDLHRGNGSQTTKSMDTSQTTMSNNIAENRNNISVICSNSIGLFLLYWNRVPLYEGRPPSKSDLSYMNNYRLMRAGLPRFWKNEVVAISIASNRHAVQFKELALGTRSTGNAGSSRSLYDVEACFSDSDTYESYCGRLNRYIILSIQFEGIYIVSICKGSLHKLRFIPTGHHSNISDITKILINPVSRLRDNCDKQQESSFSSLGDDSTAIATTSSPLIPAAADSGAHMKILSSERQLELSFSGYDRSSRTHVDLTCTLLDVQYSDSSRSMDELLMSTETPASSSTRSPSTDLNFYDSDTFFNICSKNYFSVSTSKEAK